MSATAKNSETSMLRVWQDTARSPAENLAVDELLLDDVASTGPVLRFYQWARPAFSIGYFQPYSAAPAGDWTIVRRASGGGVVDHRHDFSFSMVFPRDHRLYRLGPGESYRVINGAVRRALEQLGMACRLAGKDLTAGVDRAVMDCFANVARYDVLSNGDKVAGGAQRRRPNGLLHQGSILLTRLLSPGHTPGGRGRTACAPPRRTLAASLTNAFAEVLWARLGVFTPPADFRHRAAELGRTKYAGDAWSHKK